MIPRDWEGTNFYNDLRVQPSASYSEIHKAHRRRVREVHPDIASNEDHSAEFIRISLAYSVLSNEEKRREYDQYLFGQEEVTPVDKVRKRRKRALGFLGRIALLCILLLLVRAGAITGGASSATSSGSGLSHFITNNSTSTLNINDNQVLALIVGPQGPPGPAGVAGKNGFIGMNGYQGKDGLPGAPGAVGPQGLKGDAGPQGPAGPAGPAGTNGLPGAQGPIGPAGPAGANGFNGTNGTDGTNGTIGRDGAGVLIVAMPVDAHAAHCPLGGTQLIASDGTTSYACNGTGGSATLTPGTVFGQGRIQIGACDTAVDIALDDSYSGALTDFVMNAIILRSLAGACDGLQLSAYLNTGNSSNFKYGSSATYSLGDVIQCTTILHLDTLSANNVVSLGNPDCVNYSASGKPPFNLHNLSARDIPDVGSALLIEIKQP